MRSKEYLILEAFFNTPKHWSFDELQKRTKVSKPQLSLWLKRFAEEGLIKRIKPGGKMPYYVGIFEKPEFRNRKRLYALEQMTKSGLLNHLSSLRDAKVVILFGSFSRWDWYDNSDLDIFIYGKDDYFEQGKYEIKMRREIQVHTAKDKNDLKRMNKMLPYILSGDFIKGNIADLEVSIVA
ncbi:nucleotidyltransferase domain-containing protein [Candidatus Woesearchaeota archaeon]|nr:nucleotidyltransferase domain-containing protein [Candidatus Woesearchaeota archaeon]